MGSDERPLQNNCAAYAVEPKALRKFVLSKFFKHLLDAAMFVPYLVTQIWIIEDQIDTFLDWVMIAATMLLLISVFFRFFFSLYMLRRSTVYTTPDCVIFCKRVWRPYSNVRYIAYRIDRITEQDGNENQNPSTIKDRSQAVYLGEDGQPVRPPRLCRKVEIPPVFAGKEEICQVLGDIESATDRADGRSFLSWLRD